jgi:hypothetical protein
MLVALQTFCGGMLGKQHRKIVLDRVSLNKRHKSPIGILGQ